MTFASTSPYSRTIAPAAEQADNLPLLPRRTGSLYQLCDAFAGVN